MKHRSWLHWKGGRTKITGQQTHAARTVLGQLQNSLRLGGATTGVLRRTMTDGTLIEAFMNAGQPSVRVTPVGAEVGAAQTLISTMYVTLFDSNGVQAIAAAPAGKYRVIGPEAYSKLAGVEPPIPESYVLFDAEADPVGLHATEDGKSVMVNSYQSASAFADSIIEVSTKDYSIVRNTYLDVNSIEGVYGGSWCTQSTDENFYIGTLFGAFSGESGIMEVSRDPAASFPARSFNTAPFIYAVYDMAISPNGRYIFAVDFAVSQGVVIDIASGSVVNTFTFDGMNGADAIVISSDGQRLYTLGDHDDTGAVGQDRVMAQFAVSYDDDGQLVGVSFLGKVRGGDPQGLRLTPNGNTLYVSDAVNPFMMEYDVEQIPVMGNLVSDDGLTALNHPGRVKIPMPAHGFNYLVPFRFAISPDGKYLYYPAAGSGDPELEHKVLVLSLRTRSVVAEVVFQGYPVAVVLSNTVQDY